jgi:hypothetical protein
VSLIFQREENARLGIKQKTQNSLEKIENASLRILSSFQNRSLYSCCSLCLERSTPAPPKVGSNVPSSVEHPFPHALLCHPAILCSWYSLLSEMILCVHTFGCPTPPSEYQLYEGENLTALISLLSWVLKPHLTDSDVQ